MYIPTMMSDPNSNRDHEGYEVRPTERKTTVVLTLFELFRPFHPFSTVQRESVFHVQQVRGSFGYSRSLLLLRFVAERPLAAALNRLFSAAFHLLLCGFQLASPNANNNMRARFKPWLYHAGKCSKDSQ